MEAIRNIEITKDFQNGAKILVLCKEYGLSRSRIYEIVNRKLKFCEKHKMHYYSACKSCKNSKNWDSFMKSEYKDYKGQIKIASKRNNDSNSVMYRKTLIEILVDDHKLSFVEVGKLIKRSHSAVSKLYNA